MYSNIQSMNSMLNPIYSSIPTHLNGYVYPLDLSIKQSHHSQPQPQSQPYHPLLTHPMSHTLAPPVMPALMTHAMPDMMPLLAYNHHIYNNDIHRSYGVLPSLQPSMSSTSFSDHLQRLRAHVLTQQQSQQCCEQTSQPFTCCNALNVSLNPNIDSSFAFNSNSKSRESRDHHNAVSHDLSSRDNSYVWNPISKSKTETQTRDTMTSSMNKHVTKTELIVINSDSENNSINDSLNQIEIESNPTITSTDPTTTTTTTVTSSSVMTTTTTTTTMSTNTNTTTKQLKDYKLFQTCSSLQSQSSQLSSNRTSIRQTKTVEVQCDGPDWTPITLPLQLRNKLEKAIERRKRRLSDTLNACPQSQHEMIKRKKCKQKHKHLESKQKQNKDLNNCLKTKQKRCESKSHKHCSSSSSSSSSSVSSMVGSVGRKQRSMLECLMNSSGYIGDQIKEGSNLFSTDPRQLSREERALLRAIKHFEKLEKPEQETETNKQNTSIKENEEKQTKTTNNVCDDVIDEKKIKTKTKLRKRLLEKQKRILKSNVKSNENQNKTKQKKTLNVRRRRFRSGLDMIRRPNCNRRKKQNKQNEVKQQQQHQQRQQIVSTNGLRLMVNKALGETVLHRAARTNRKDVIIYCLSLDRTRECDINARDNAGYTPLHECCTRGHVGIAELLLQNNADVNASAAGGIRPLHDAVENDHMDVVRLLLSYGADPIVTTYSGSTPLTLSRSKRMTKFIKGFLSDISCDHMTSSEVLPWKFDHVNGCDVLDTCSIQTHNDVITDHNSREFVFETSSKCETLTTNTWSHSKQSFIRLNDLLLKTNFQTKQQLIEKNPKIEFKTIENNEYFNQLLTIFQKPIKKSLINEEFVVFDENIKQLLDIKTIKIKL